MTPSRALLLLATALAFPAIAAAQVTYTWTGNATDFSSYYAEASATQGANWQGSTAPASSETNTLLAFGPSAGIDPHQSLYVSIPSSFNVAGLLFDAPLPFYIFSIDGSGTLGLGAAGITLSDCAETSDEVYLANGTVRLFASQTWNTGPAVLMVKSRIVENASEYSLTKTGVGGLQLLANNNTFSGGLVVQSGSLVINGSSTYDTSASKIVSGPVGTGTLSLAPGTSLLTQTTDDVVLHNPLSLGTNVTLGSVWEWHDSDLVLHGPVTPTASTTTIKLTPNATVFFKGALGSGTNGDSNITFTSSDVEEQLAINEGSGNGFPVAVLSGTNVGLGNVTVTEAGVVFLTNAAIPNATKTLSANDGYIGVGEQGGMETVLTRIADRTNFTGALGFDTDPDASSTPTTFNDAIDLDGNGSTLTTFTPDTSPTSGFWGLGSLTTAKLTGTITPPTGGNYVFGGGDGTLYVQSALSAATGVRVRTPFGDDPLTVWLQGNNTFTGKLLSDHSVVILDSANALPATNAGNPDTGRFQMDSGAYVGYTETTGWTPAQFLARFVPTESNSQSVLGFDSANPSGRTIADAIDLSPTSAAWAAGSTPPEHIYLGTTTHVHLTSDDLKAPGASQQLSLAGVDGGWLTIEGQLKTANVSSVLIGLPDTEALANGIVEITNASSNYTGGTQLQSGYLILGASSTEVSNTVTAGPLGTGTLTIDDVSWSSKPTLVAGNTSVTLHNPIVIGNGATARFGAPVTTDEDDAASTLTAGHLTNDLTLAGDLSGNPGSLYFSGNGTITLAGDNSGLATTFISIGDESGLGSGRPLVVAATNTAFGTGSANHLYLQGGSDVQFTSSAPSLGGISGGYPEETNTSFIALEPGSTLTLNQNFDTWLWAKIGGTPADFDGTASTPTTAALVKNGTGTLTLASANNYSGGTTINAGTIVAAHASALGSSAITLAGGSLGVASGIVLVNPLVFPTTGTTKLGGTGTVASAITVDSHVILAPGNSPGTLTFTNTLTLAGGGTLSIEIADLYGSAGSSYDTILVSNTGSLNLTATSGNTFHIQINSLTSLSGSIGLLGHESDSAASLTLLTSPTALTLADLDRFTLNTTNFTSPSPGLFSLALGGVGNTALMLNFTPVPEPSTYALMALGLGAVIWQVRRRRSRS